MTSKNLFFKLIRQDFKKRIWCPILIFIGYFLILEVPMLMQMENMEKYPGNFDYDMAFYVTNKFFGSYVMMVVSAMCVAAFLCALSGFAYLHSKMQLDAYHSMPVSRTKLFWSQYVSGALQCMLPFLANILICLGIAATRGALNREGVWNAFCFSGTSLLAFLLAYSASILAACLTGNIIVSILGTGVLFAYSTVLSALKSALFQRFFDTFTLYWYQEQYTFSPLGMLIRLGSNENRIVIKRFSFDYGSAAGTLGLILFATVIYAAASYALYLKRPTESAGKAIAFGWAEPVIKFMIVVPAALHCGLFFESISAFYHSFGWFLFGVVFGFVIFCLLMEIIFRLDIRGALQHKKQFLFNAACTALLVIILQNDVLGYDAYVPSDKQVQSCAVSIDGLMDYYLREVNESGYSDYVSMEEYRMRTMQMQGNPSVMELARKAAKESLQHVMIDYYDGIEDQPEYETVQHQREYYHSVTFGYHLTNGKKVYRSYVIDLSDAQTFALLSDIFGDGQYKLGSTPILNIGWSQEYTAVSCKNNFSKEEIALTGEMQTELLEKYQSDFMKLSFEDAIHTIPIGAIQFIKVREELDNYYSSSGIYQIYPQFTDTIALMKEYGFDFEEQLGAEDVSAVEIYYYGAKEDVEIDGETVSADVTNAVYTERNEIAQILENVVRREFNDSSWAYLDGLYDQYYGISIKRADGKTTAKYYRDDSESFPYGFRKDMAPDFVRLQFGRQ